jgi:hypothetical protein
MIPRRDVLGLLVAIAMSAPAPAIAQTHYTGQRLEEALRTLQAAGLRIIFSSEIVTRDMRVTAEPRGQRPREVLDELLKPHHLLAEDGPAGTIKIVRAKAPGPAAKPPPATQPARARTAAATGDGSQPTQYRESITVTTPWTNRGERAVGSEMRLDSREVQAFSTAGTADDPMRAVQAAPFAANDDDFRTDVSIRGSPYRQTTVAVDGVTTPWLQHAMYATGETTSLAMLNGLVVQSATLQAGVYPRRLSDSLGGHVDLTLREGLRTARRWQGTVGATHALVTGEGPLGRDNRGSWLVGVRQSWREWPNRLTSDYSGKAFGFSDGQAKIVYDAPSNQQITFTALAGRSVVDERGSGEPGDLATAANHAGMLTLGWRRTFGSAGILSQRVSLVGHRYVDTDQTSREVARGRDSQFVYRAEAGRQMRSVMVDGGAQAERVYTSRRLGSILDPALNMWRGMQPGESLAGSSWLRSGYVHATWTPFSRVTVAPGLRVTDSTLLRRAAVSRWVLSEWAVAADWSLRASAGISHQFPDVPQSLVGDTRAADLKPERAQEIDGGLEHRVSPSIRWQATIFRRDERDVLREPDPLPRLVDGVLVDPLDPWRCRNALRGSARGGELLLQRSAPTGLSGWIAYSYGKTRATDLERRETYWADFDQRHGVAAAAIYPLSGRTMVALRFRAGSNFPIAGYFSRRDDLLFVGERRNDARFPFYARLDLHASRTYEYSSHRVMVFIDVVNVLNRANVGPAAGWIDRSTGRAIGFSRPLFPRLPSAGLSIEF